MILSLLKKIRPAKPGTTPSVPDGTRVYAIGDVHGCAGLFAALLTEIGGELRTDGHVRGIVVLLGDLVDRGPDSRRVVEMAMIPPLPHSARLVALMGNHERMMLDVLEGNPELLARWLSYGGAATAASYGVAPIVGTATPERLARLATEFAAAVPAEHRTFLAALPTSWRIGDYFLVHAGIRAGTALDLQNPDDLMWAGEAFVESRRDHGAIVVHGHHIGPDPVVRQNRIGVDTGAYCTGTLSCLVLEGSERRLIQAGAAGIRRSALPLPPRHPA